MKRVEVSSVKEAYYGLSRDDRVSSSVEKGEILAILGRNGAGKTTLMVTLEGLEKRGIEGL